MNESLTADQRTYETCRPHITYGKETRGTGSRRSRHDDIGVRTDALNSRPHVHISIHKISYVHLNWPFSKVTLSMLKGKQALVIDQYHLSY